MCYHVTTWPSAFTESFQTARWPQTMHRPMLLSPRKGVFDDTREPINNSCHCPRITSPCPRYRDLSPCSCPRVSSLCSCTCPRALSPCPCPCSWTTSPCPRTLGPWQQHCRQLHHQPPSIDRRWTHCNDSSGFLLHPFPVLRHRRRCWCPNRTNWSSCLLYTSPSPRD